MVSVLDFWKISFLEICSSELLLIFMPVIVTVCADPHNGIQLPSLSGLQRYSGLLEYLQTHLKTPLSVMEMAQLAGMGKELFVKKFRLDTGCSPKRFFHWLRIRVAEQQLLRSERSVKEVAEELGFCNEFYFSRFFKKYTGVSPTQFRRRNRFENPVPTPSDGTPVRLCSLQPQVPDRGGG